jgi:hypothetical protein
MQMPPALGPRPAIAHWLQALRQIAAPQGLLHVGAGRVDPAATNPLHAVYAQAPVVVAIEADEARAAELKAAFAAHPHVRVQHALVAPQAGRRKMLRASLDEESGLCPPEQLRGVWPRLQQLHDEDVDAMGIADSWQVATPAAGRPNVDAAQPNWLFVDCLPAMELLQAAPDLLAGADVVVARAVDAARLADKAAMPDELGLARLQKLLGQHGLQLLGVEEENHPALVLAVFVRNMRRQLTQQRQELDGLQAQLKASDAQRGALEGALTATKAEVEGKLAAAMAEVEATARDRADLTQQLRKARQELDGAQKAKAAADAAIAERDATLQRAQQEAKTQLSDLRKAKQESEAGAAERGAAMRQTLDELNTQLTAAQKAKAAAESAVTDREANLRRLNQERIALQATLDERQAQIQQLTQAAEEQARTAAQRQQQLEQLGRVRQDLLQQVENLTRMRGELQQRLQDLASKDEEQRKREENLAQELREARQTITLSLRLQSLREADLRDLQARYKASAQVQERQHELLTQLGERLRVASAYFHQLAATEAPVERIAAAPARPTVARKRKSAAPEAPKPSRGSRREPKA